MKKLIIVVMALITIFSASVTAHAEVYVDWQVVDTITNIVCDSYNCTIVKHNTASPTPTMTNASGARGTQKTTYDVLYSLYETVSVNGASFQMNLLKTGVFEWYEYGGYCWIEFDADEDTNIYWVSNNNGKILYCDAPTTSNGYTISAIAGVSNYYLTDRPVNTSGGGYSGDLALTYSNWLNIKETLNNLSGDQSFYTYGHSINGEFRYYLAYRPNTYTYYVCDSAGRLFYTVKESADSGGSGDGSSFDATEVITAINSVYDALDYGFWDVCNWLEAIQDNISSFNTDVLIMSQNMTNGFADLRNVGNTINTTLGIINSNLLYTGDNITSALEKYFHSLGKAYPQLMTVKLSGNDNLFEWDDGDIIQDIRASNPDGEVHIKKTFLGDDSIGYEDVTLVNPEDGYYLYKYNGKWRIKSLPVGRGSLTVNENVLSNWDFRNPVNTTGSVVYDTNGYSIDDWYLMNGTYSVATHTLANTVDGKTSYFRTALDVTQFLGKTITVSFFVDSLSDSFYCNIGTSASISDIRYDLVQSGLQYEQGLYSFTFSVPNDVDISSYPYFTISFAVRDGNTLGLSAIKVEEGSSHTFAYQSNDGLWRFYDEMYTPDVPPILSFGGKSYELSLTLSSIGNLTDVIYFSEGLLVWRVQRYPDAVYKTLPDSDQEILNQTIYIPPNINTVPISDFTASSAPPLFYDGLNHIDIDGDTVVTIEYYHNGSWFDYMYSMMDKLYERIGEVDGAVVNIENTVVDIVQDNDAFNVFYVEKSDGTTESVGDAATDAAKVVGEFLSIFYRLVFEDALSNADIIHDFEDVYTDSNTGVSVW